jgi:glycosyltransferase involved in cell wall biosynthesis
VPAIVRTEHLAELPAVFATEELPDLVYSPYHLPDRRPQLEELQWMVARERAAYLDTARLVDRIICVSGGVRDTYTEVGVDPQKLRVVRNGIRPVSAARARGEVRERLGLPDDRPVVLSVGRMIDVKGHLFLLGAVAEVARRRPDILFVWVGGGPLEDELRRRVSDLGLQGSVWFAGRRDDVPDLIGTADLFLLASIVEGLPLVVLEAMAAGRPVVGTRVCGTSEVVQDGVTGRLVGSGRLDGSGDTAALAAAILEPLEQPDLGAAWGSAGRRLFEREFTSARMARETAAVYDELINRPGLPRQVGSRLLTEKASARAPR